MDSSSLRGLARPRVALGVALIAGSMWWGAQLVGADPTTTLMVAARDLPAGITVRSVDLRTIQVQLPDPSKYLNERPESGMLVTTPVGAGELIPHSALNAAKSPARLVALAVDAGRIAPGIERGSLVDVWATPEDGVSGLVLAEAVVAEVAEADEWSGSQSTVVLTVAERDVAEVIAASRAGSVDLIAVEPKS